jgi:hypothetical protein
MGPSPAAISHRKRSYRYGSVTLACAVLRSVLAAAFLGEEQKIVPQG